MDFIKVKRKRRTALDWYELVKQWHDSAETLQQLMPFHPKMVEKFQLKKLI